MLILNSGSPLLASQVTKITHVDHHAQLSSSLKDSLPILAVLKCLGLQELSVSAC